MERRTHDTSPIQKEKESRNEGQLTLRDLGFQDRKHSIGFANAPVRLHTTIDPENGSNVFFVAIDYPLKGGGLLEFLREVSPIKGQSRNAVLDDWDLPDDAKRKMDLAHLHHTHQSIPGYSEFDEHHRESWMDAISVRGYDAYFKTLNERVYFDTEKFILGQWEEREAEIFGYPPYDRQHIPAWMNKEQEFIGAVSTYIQSPKSLKFMRGLDELEMIDPQSGVIVEDGIRAKYEPAVFIKTTPSGLHIVESHSGVTADITLGGIDDRGFYDQDVTMQFDEEYRRDALFPVIAWKETKGGKRWFLSQVEMQRLMPADMHQQGADVVLGRVGLAYLEQDIADGFDKAMGFPQVPNSRQGMGLAQLPVLVSMPSIAKSLLYAEQVTALQEHISQSSPKFDAPLPLESANVLVDWSGDSEPDPRKKTL